MRCLPLAGLVLCAHPAFAMQVGGQAQITQEGIEFNERVIELTEPVLRGLIRGLDVEIALLEEFDQLLATYPIPGEYMACKGRLAASPELQKIQMQVLDWPDNATPEQAQRLSEKMAADMAALLKRKCGGDILTEWPEHKRRERVEEIHYSAAAAAGLLLSTPQQQGPGGSAIDEGPVPGLAQGPGSTAPYDIARERVDAYCAWKKKFGEGPIIPGYSPPPGRWEFKAKLLNPAVSDGVFWVFRMEELAAIERVGGCEPLVLKAGKAILEMDAIYIRGRTPIKLKR